MILKHVSSSLSARRCASGVDAEPSVGATGVSRTGELGFESGGEGNAFAKVTGSLACGSLTERRRHARTRDKKSSNHVVDSEGTSVARAKKSRGRKICVTIR